MSYHRFKIDQTVVPSATSIPFGLYIILRLLPLVDDEPRYRIRGAGDRLERAVSQSEIRLLRPRETRPGRGHPVGRAAEEEPPNGSLLEAATERRQQWQHSLLWSGSSGRFQRRALRVLDCM
jgi:hypothetical protein